MIDFLIERFKMFPRIDGAIWQGIRIRSAWMNDENKNIFCPHLMLWASISPDNYILSEPKIYIDLPSNAQLLNQLLQSLHIDDPHCGYRPSVIEIKDANLADFLREKLEPLGIQIRLKKSLPEIEEIAIDLQKHMGINDSDPDSLINSNLFDISNISADQFASFYDAAGKLYNSEPWHYFSDTDLIKINHKSADGAKYPEVFVIMGCGGMEYGLSFFKNSDQFDDIMIQAATKKSPKMPSSGLWALNYVDITELQIPELEVWERYKWPVANECAFPAMLNFYCKNRKYKIKRPDSAQLDFFEGIIRFLDNKVGMLHKKGSVTGKIKTFLGTQEIGLFLG